MEFLQPFDDKRKLQMRGHNRWSSFAIHELNVELSMICKEASCLCGTQCFMLAHDRMKPPTGDEPNDVAVWEIRRDQADYECHEPIASTQACVPDVPQQRQPFEKQEHAQNRFRKEMDDMVKASTEQQPRQNETASVNHD
jgi:hypothetical protein